MAVEDQVHLSIQEALRSIQQIEQALHAATTINPSVSPGSTSDVTRAIDDAVKAADSTVNANIDLKGDEGLKAACEEAACVDDNLKESTKSAEGLGGALKGVVAVLVAAGATKFFVDATMAAADLGEAVNKVQVVFGTAGDEILAFGETSATALGLASTEAYGLAGSFGILFQAAGLTQAESARLSRSLIEISGDIASLQNVSGGAAGASEALGAALRGEAEPARALGIILNDEVITRAAVREGIAAEGEALTAQQKILATYSEIVRQSAVAHGDFSNTINSLPNQLRILDASWQDAQARIGQGLLPTATTLVGIFNGEVIPSIERLATSVVPALVAVLEGLAPLMGTTTDLAVAFAPALEAIGEALQAIPPEVLQVIALTAVLSKGFLAVNAAVTAAQVSIKAFGSAAAGPAGLAFAIGAVAATLLVYATRADEATVDTRALEDAFRDTSDAAESFQQRIERSLGAGIVDQEDVELLNRYGLSVDELARLIDRYGVATAGVIARQRGWAEGARLTVDEFKDLNDEQQHLIEIVDTATVTIEQQSQAQLESLVFTGQLTQAQVDQAEALVRTRDTMVDGVRIANFYSTVLQEATRDLREQQRQQTTLAEGYATSAAAIRDSSAAYFAQIDSVRQLRGELDPYAASLELTQSQQIRLREEMRHGSLTTSDFIALANQLGVTVEQLAAAEQSATDQIAADLARQSDAINTWADTITANMPTAASAFAQFNDEVTIEDALARFQEDAANFVLAQQVLSDLLSRGFTDLARAIATESPSVVAQLRDASDAELAEMEAMVDGTNQTLVDAQPLVRQNARDLAETIPAGFGSGLEGDVMGQATGDAIGQVVTAMGAAAAQDASNPIWTAGALVGEALAAGLKAGMEAQIPDTAAKANALGLAAAQAVASGAGVHSPSTITYAAGLDVAQGLADGIADGQGIVTTPAFGLGKVVADSVTEGLLANMRAPRSGFGDQAAINRTALAELQAAQQAAALVAQQRDLAINPQAIARRNDRGGYVDYRDGFSNLLHERDRTSTTINVYESVDGQATAAAVDARIAISATR